MEYLALIYFIGCAFACYLALRRAIKEQRNGSTIKHFYSMIAFIVALSWLYVFFEFFIIAKNGDD